MEQVGKIYSLIPKIMAEVGAIQKTRQNQVQGYPFRGIDDVYLALQGPLAKHGVFFSPEVITRETKERTSSKGAALIYTILTMRFTFFADDGSFFQTITVGEAMDSGDKSCNKAMSVALKYALLQLFCIPTEELKDTEHESPEIAQAEEMPAGGVNTQVEMKTALINKPENKSAASGGGVRYHNPAFRFTFGKFKGKTCSECDIYELNGWVHYMNGLQDLKPKQKDEITQAELFLASREKENREVIKEVTGNGTVNMSVREPAFNSDEEMPF